MLFGYDEKGKAEELCFWCVCVLKHTNHAINDDALTFNLNTTKAMLYV